MTLLKIIFVLLLMIPLVILAVFLLNKLFDNALKYKEKPSKRDPDRRKRKR